MAGAAAAAKGLAAPAGVGVAAGEGLLAGGTLGVSPPVLAGVLGLRTAPWLARTVEDRLLAEGAEVGVSLRSTRGATFGAEARGEAEAVAPLEGVA